jgi:hypothetical protein
MIVDATAVAAVGLAVVHAASDRAFMTMFVAATVAVRTIVVLAHHRRGVSIPGELVFFALCTLVGGFNDWNTVYRHGVYDYAVPYELAGVRIPAWMLLYWGLILRFTARLARWASLRPPSHPSDFVGFGEWRTQNAALKVGVELLLVVLTRQAIYRLYDDPALSWPAFLAALMAWAVLLRPTRHDLHLLLIALVIGPAVESAFIRWGGLHVYRHGIIGGVPIWIVLWWALAVVIWKDLALRIETGLCAVFVRERVLHSDGGLGANRTTPPTM